MLTEKENYLRVLHGEIPEWIPSYTFGKMPGSDVDPANIIVEPPILCEHRDNGGGKDHWGVEHVFQPRVSRRWTRPRLGIISLTILPSGGTS